MIYNKQPLSHEAQLAGLSDRGLEINDQDHALHILERINYFRLSAYWYPVKNNKSGQV